MDGVDGQDESGDKDGCTTVTTTIGVDVGATTISGGLVTREGEILHSVQTPTRGDGPETALERLLGVIDALLTVARDQGLPLDGIGVGVAGVVDPETRTM